MAEVSFDKAQGKKVDVKKMECCHPRKWHGGHGAGGAVFFFAFIGVAVYNIQQVHGFWLIVLAILKAIVWPAFLMHQVFTMLHM